MKTFSRTFRVGPYEIEAIAIIENGQAISLNFEWSPELPESLSNIQIAEYSNQRDAVIADLAQEIGAGQAQIVEI